jgi:hypothetical protein
VLWIWVSSAAKGFSAVDLSGAVPARKVRDFAIHLNELGIIDIGAESCLYGFKVGAMPIACDLHSACQPFRQIADKLNRSRAAIAAVSSSNCR